MSDLNTIRNEPLEGCSASPHFDENLFVWSTTIFGPDENPWEGGFFG
jgi:ubiquitin-conjugating enzyme E2 A